MNAKYLWGLVPLLALALPLLAQSTPNPVKGYKSGKALLKQPIKMENLTNQLCAYTLHREIAVKEKDPHFFKYAQVHVNPTGQAATQRYQQALKRLEQECQQYSKKHPAAYSNGEMQRFADKRWSHPAPFPVGTVFTKEKFDNPRGTGTPELLTAMVKREKGYNPSCYDWEFLVLDGKAERILERGKLARCQSCHQDKQYQRTDGVVTLMHWGMPLASLGSR